MGESPVCIMGVIQNPFEESSIEEEVETGSLVAFWFPITLQQDLGGSTPPVEWVMEYGVVMEEPPLETDTAANPPHEGYRNRVVEAAYEVGVHHLRKDGLRRSLGYYPNSWMVRGFFDEHTPEKEASLRLLTTEEYNIPTSMSTKFMEVSYSWEDLEISREEGMEMVDGVPEVRASNWTGITME